MDIVVALNNQIPDDLAESCRVLVVNSDIDNLVQELLRNLIHILVSLDVLNDLLEMLFLWPNCQSLEQVFVDQRVHLHLLFSKNVTSQKLRRLFSFGLSHQR